MITVTKQLLEQGMSDNGAWNLAQLKALLPKSEFSRPFAWPSKGWKYRLIGSKVTKHQIERFLRLKNKHLERTGLLAFEGSSHLRSIKQELKHRIA